MACDAASAAMRCMLCLWRMDMTRRRYRPEVEGSESRFSVSPIRAAADQSTDPLGLFPAVQSDLAQSRMRPHLDRSCRRFMPVAPTVLCVPTAISAPQRTDQKGDSLSVFLEEIADDG